MTQHSDEQDIRDLFTAWLQASSDKDIEAAMAPIADEVLSYEHHVPLQYRGVDTLRDTCQQGFDIMVGDFTWTIPDLQVIVRGDIAVTWGINRMYAKAPGTPPIEHHSRGTRIFQKIAGQWKMIHQHVSFPFDPATGQARMDLHP